MGVSVARRPAALGVVEYNVPTDRGRGGPAAGR
jgi:hypothetical protein